MAEEKEEVLETQSADGAEIRDTDIVFDCPHCSKTLVIDYRGAGLQINCSECGKDVLVPIPDGKHCPEEDQWNTRKSERVYEKGLFAHSSANPSAITCCMTASVSCSDTSRALSPCTRVSAFW